MVNEYIIIFGILIGIGVVLTIWSFVRIYNTKFNVFLLVLGIPLFLSGIMGIIMQILMNV